MLDLGEEVLRMPWREVTGGALRKEFVLLAMQAGSNRRELGRRFGIGPKTGYKWLLRYTQAGASGLEDRSKRPRRSPARTATEVEQAVVRLRHESRNSWGGVKRIKPAIKNAATTRGARAPLANQQEFMPVM